MKPKRDGVFIRTYKCFITFYKFSVADLVKMIKRRKLSNIERQQLYDMFEGHCAYCGCEITLKQMQADHVEPLELGGADNISNLFPTCRSCNHYKHSITLSIF